MPQSSADACDSYSVAELLTQSRSSVVYRAVRTADGRPVVLKVLDPRKSGPKELAQLKREYDFGKLVGAPAIVEPLSLTTFGGMPALVMEDFDAKSLDHVIDGPMAVELFLTLASRIAGAVAELHAQDLVHKDLKPENILVGPPPQRDVKIGDLGIASLLGRARSSRQRPNQIEGSLAYMAPEQTGRMNRSVDTRSDLYALGVTFYEMLTGQLPFQANDPLTWVHCHVAHRPRPPRELVPDVPEVLSDIVLKLLAKLAEDRYQTARGLEHDLALCAADWKRTGHIAPFPLGRRDISDRFEIPEQLLGRQKELAELVDAFERVAGSGIPELVLVSGYSGIGKSALVRELHRPVAGAHGFFASGKFDQYKRDIPYSTFAQAFTELIEQVLTESEERVASWKTELQRALGVNAQLVIDVIPQLELIVGPQPPVIPVPPLEAQNRFHIAFRQLVSVFARKEHPLALFLDDLQWLDSGSLKLIEDIILHRQTRHLLLLGAYRDNEVGPSHPLRIMLDEIRATEALVRKVVLGPLDGRQLARLIGNTLHCSAHRAAPLARLVQAKTGGNAFFAIQFLTTLYQEGLLTFDRAAAAWRWDVARIEAKDFTDNVLDLMARKLSRLPGATRDALKLAACVGSRTDLRMLAIISNQSEEETASRLSEAVAEGVVLRIEDVYAFLHDRVEQAAYALIGEDEKKEIHLRIGRLLLRSLDPRCLEERIFEVVSQLNRGAVLITDADERDKLVKLDVMAATRAKAAIAYATARNLFAFAASLLPPDAWSSRYDVIFHILIEQAECEYLCGAFEEAESLFEILLERARTDLDRAAVDKRRLKLCQLAGKYDEAVAIGLKALRRFGVEMPEDEDALDRAIRDEAASVKIHLGDRTIAELANTPETTDPVAQAVMDLIGNVAPAIYKGGRRQLFTLVALKQVNYHLQFGATQESSHACGGYAILLASRFDDPRSALEFSKVAIELSQRPSNLRYLGLSLYLCGNHTNHWVNPIATSFPILERGFAACIDSGDVVSAGDIVYAIVWQAIERYDTLDDVLAFSQKYAAFARDWRNEALYQTIRSDQQFIACLKGATRDPTSFESSVPDTFDTPDASHAFDMSGAGESFDEAKCLATITGASFTTGLAFYHIAKLVAVYLAGDDSLALHHATEARAILGAVMSMPIESTFYYFESLLLARIYPRQSADRRREIFETLTAHEEKLAFWASTCPENFATKHALVAAELARIRGDELQAERRYEEAIRSARANGFVHWQAIANEHAARFHRERGFETIADAYLREALHGYVRWGAEAKVKELERRHPQLRRPASLGSTATFVARAEHLDLLSVVKASQSISGVMVKEQLLRALLQLVLEEGGGRRARLVLPGEGELVIAAEAAVEAASSKISPGCGGERDLATSIPLSVLLYVQRTGERIVLDDAAIGGRFRSDPYFARVRPRSAVCLPILREAEVVALLYLENDLVPGAFTPERLLALELLAAQAAISLENALLLEREHGARVEAEMARERALFLAEATSVMTATLDYDGVFATLTRLCVRSLADWAVIDLIEDEQVVRLAGAHRDPAKESLLRALSERYPARFDTTAPAAGVLRSGEPMHLSAITDDQVRATTVDTQHAELIRELGTRSAIVVPLIVRDTRLGALTLSAARPNRFAPGDVEMAAELGRRAALAIDNARLLHETQQALRLREEFLTLASHELRTPLTSLRLTVETLIQLAESGKAMPREIVAQSLRRIVRKTERLQDLSEELLDAALIENGELSLRRTAVDLPALVKEIVKRLEPDLRAASCSMTVTHDGAIVGTWDRLRIAQVITSLLSNAVKFGAGRPIDVHLHEAGGSASLVVEDHGIGIDEAKLARVFERFERGVSSSHYGGLGLGLYVARSIVQAHGGTIRVRSQLGVGSQFIVELPVHRAPLDVVHSTLH